MNMKTANGTVRAAYTAATRPGERVSENTSPARATNRNQSPENDTTWARNSRRKSRLRRSRLMTACRCERLAERGRGGSVDSIPDGEPTSARAIPVQAGWGTLVLSGEVN